MTKFKKTNQRYLEPELQEKTTITANVAPNAVTFEWQKYSSVERFLRNAAYALRFLPKFSENRTTTGSI